MPPNQPKGHAKILRSGVMASERLFRSDALLGLAEVGREASVLDDETWKEVDDELIAILREQAVFPEVLAQFGITRELGNFGRRAYDVWDADDSFAATLEAGLGPVKASTPARSRNRTTIMSVYADIQVDPIDLEASKHGLMEPLDAIGIREATEVVVDQLNAFLATGSSDEGVDGVLNKTSRTSFTGTDWTTAGNGLADVRGMSRRLFADNVPEGVKRILFVNPTNYEELQQEKTNTLGSQVEVALKSGEVARIVRTNRRTVGTATMVAMSRGWMRHGVFQPVKVTELGSLGMTPLFRVWTRQAIWNSKAKTVVDATAI